MPGRKDKKRAPDRGDAGGSAEGNGVDKVRNKRLLQTTTMQYETRDGRKVIKSGWVVIEGVNHYVNNFYVVCNNALNQKAWNITEKEKDCQECLKKTEFKPVQLQLFNYYNG